jgi:hypothetical protein
VVVIGWTWSECFYLSFAEGKERIKDEIGGR